MRTLSIIQIRHILFLCICIVLTNYSYAVSVVGTPKTSFTVNNIPSETKTTTSLSDGSECTAVAKISVSDRMGNYYAFVVSVDDTDYDGFLTRTEYNYDLGKGVPTQTITLVDGADNMLRACSYSDYKLCDNGWQPGTVENRQMHNDDCSMFFQTTAYTYDKQGNVLTKKENADSSCPLTTHYTYDVYGNILTSYEEGDGVEKNVVNNEYDASGRFLTRITETASTETHTFAYDKWGQLIAEREYADTLKLTEQRHDYDAWGNETRSVDVYGNVRTMMAGWGDSPEKKYYVLVSPEGEPWTKTWYDNAGHEVLTESVGLKGVGISSANEYDEAGHIAHSSNTMGLLRKTTDCTYDCRGRVVATSSSTGEYVGITRRPVNKRFYEHYKSKSTRSSLSYTPINNTGNLSAIQARIIEQK